MTKQPSERVVAEYVLVPRELGAEEIAALTAYQEARDDK